MMPIYPSPLNGPPGPFPLAGLPPHLLEKIITKTKENDYHRLMQTCKSLEQLAQTNKNLTIYFRKQCWLLWKEDENGLCRLEAIMGRGERQQYRLDIESLYGIRFERLTLPEFIEDVDLFCNAVKNFRISAEHLPLSGGHLPLLNMDLRGLTNENLVTLFGTLKPRNIELDSRGSSRFEALFHLTSLKEAHVAVDSADSLNVVKTLLPKLQTLFVDQRSRIEPVDHAFHHFLPIIEFLRSEALPSSLRFFVFHGPRYHGMPTLDKVMETFHDLNPVVERNDVYNYLLRCPFDGPGIICEISVNYVGSHIKFTRE